MKLNTKLVMMMTSLLIIAMLVLFLLNQYSQNDLVKEIQESSTEISKAIQISVEDLTSATEPETSRLKTYLLEAKNKGINEINIISNEGEIINSSDPEKVGKKRDVRKMGTGLKATKSKVPGTQSLKPYELVVPVIVGDEQLGYVHIDILLDNIREIQHANFLKRVGATFLLFLIAMILSFYLAKRYTRPIMTLADGVKKVSAGDLSVTFPGQSRDEIGELAASFNEMVAKLREREALEKRLYEAEHLSKVGQLASGIAHEIRNPLNFISLAIDHMKGELSAPGDKAALIELAEKIKEEVRRANYMVLNFMNYGRPLKLRKAEVSYDDLLAKILPLVNERFDEQRITIKIETPADLPPLQVDQELMRNCIFNFIANAAQSMPEGGTITLGASHDASNDLFRLTFSDHGCGIEKEDLEKIFQPYFTTKEAGIGLGLAITERIVREHGGTIDVASTRGQGTTFTVTLPG